MDSAISFARRSSRFSRSSARIRARSSVVSPGRCTGVGLGPADPLAQRLVVDRQLREIDSIAFHCDGYSPWCSNTIRTARSRTSGGYGGRPALFDSDICSSSQGDEQSPIPGRLTYPFIGSSWHGSREPCGSPGPRPRCSIDNFVLTRVLTNWHDAAGPDAGWRNQQRPEAHEAGPIGTVPSTRAARVSDAGIPDCPIPDSISPPVGIVASRRRPRSRGRTGRPTLGTQ